MPGTLLQRLDEAGRNEFWASLALRHCPGMGPRLACRVLKAYGSAYAAFRHLAGEGAGPLLPAPVLAALKAEQWREAALCEWGLAGRLDADVVLWTDEAYPERLRELPDAPVLLYARGDIGLLQAPAIGVVGTRHCSGRGRHDAGVLAGSLSAAGLVVVSGLALGVECADHL
ncbi:MAG: DNA-processing protein DprA, partial [Deltaproteobacteria bacterium]|nr:DNA-processing protein DprA [Deltaproteobacteria bacterium]